MTDTLEVVKKAEQLVEQEGNVQAAIDILEEQIKEIEKDPIIFGIDFPLVFKKLGIYYGQKGDIEKADQMFKEGLEIAKRDSNIIEQSDIFASWAFLELKMRDIEQALKYASKTEDIIGEKRGFRFAKSRCNTFIVLGDIHLKENNDEKAIEYYKRARKIAKSIKLKGVVISLRLKIVDILIEEKNFIMAGLRLEEIMKEVKKKETYPLYRCYLMLGKLDAARNQPKYAEESFKEALEYALEENNGVHIGECYEAFGDFMKGLNDTKKANEYYEKVIECYKKAQLKPDVEEVEKKLKA
jgi:tetratricopeptide (TPR) repeat protein